MESLRLKERGRSFGFFQKLYYGSFADDLLAPEHRDRGVSALELGEKLKADTSTFRELLSSLDGKRLRALTLPKEYGGLGLSHAQSIHFYRRLSETGRGPEVRAIADSLVLQWFILLFASPEQKKTFLPRLAAGEAAAPAFLDLEETTLARDNADFILTGVKVLDPWTPSPVLTAVTARDCARAGLGVFLVETGDRGVTLQDGTLRLEGVRVPVSRLIGEIGQGDHHAQAALDLSRLPLTASSGPAKRCLRGARESIIVDGQDEAASNRLTDIASRLFAMEAVAEFAADLTDRNALDHRQEAAAALTFCEQTEHEIIADTRRMWRVAVRGFHTEASSGDAALTFLGQEATQRHLRAAGAWREADKPRKERLLLLAGIAAFYAFWYPMAWLGWSWWPRFREFGRLAKQLRQVERTGRRLARAAFHGLLLHRTDYGTRTAFHERLGAIGLDLFAMTATILKVRSVLEENIGGGGAHELADLYCRDARRRIRTRFKELWSNEDALKTKIGRGLWDKRFLWLEDN